jgi:hypothetical protein
MHNVMRAVAGMVGIAIFGAVAHVTITTQGGYGQPSAILNIALACGVAVGSVVVGASHSQNRRMLACLLFLALAAGEAWGFLATAERNITSREAMQTPIHDAEARHKAALERLATAEHSDFVARAEAAKAKIDSEAMAKSAEKTCKENCRAILEGQVNAAKMAVETAKADVQREIAAARANLAQNPLPGSASPLADRLGWPAWLLDLVSAGLGSLGCNGLAMGLLIFAAHHARKAPIAATNEYNPPGPSPVPPLSADVQLIEPPKPQAIGDVRRFLLACIPRNKGADFTWGAAYARYQRWCEENGFAPMELKRFFDEFGQVCTRANIRTEQRDSKLYCIDVKLVA